MNMNFKFIIAVLSFVMCFTTFALGQRTSGNIEGTITDPNGAVVSGATVTVKSTGTTVGYNATATTDAQGFYQFTQIPVGTYEVTAMHEKLGKQTAMVTVADNGSADLNFTFKPK